MKLTDKQIKQIEELTGLEYQQGYTDNSLGKFGQWFIKTKPVNKHNGLRLVVRSLFYNEKENKFIFSKCDFDYTIPRDIEIETPIKWLAPLGKILEDK